MAEEQLLYSIAKGSLPIKKIARCTTGAKDNKFVKVFSSSFSCFYFLNTQKVWAIKSLLFQNLVLERVGVSMALIKNRTIVALQKLQAEVELKLTQAEAVRLHMEG